MMTVAPRIGLFHSVFSFLSFSVELIAIMIHHLAKFSSTKVKVTLCEFETWLWAFEWVCGLFFSTLPFIIYLHKNPDSSFKPSFRAD